MWKGRKGKLSQEAGNVDIYYEDEWSYMQMKSDRILSGQSRAHTCAYFRMQGEA